DAQMFSPFGIERVAGAETPLARAYNVLGQLTPLIVEHQGKGAMKAVIVEAGAAPQKVQIGDYVFDFAMGRGWGATQTPPGGRGGQAPARGYALVIKVGPDEYWVAGVSLNVRFASTRADTPLASLAAVEEGRFEEGRWVIGRRLAGDDTGQGGDDRAGLRLPANPGILRVQLYSYR
ncbi:MAG TPA: DUF5597 domain-containing protein, partial [Bryobacteraceae bacterium]|nr:DUF5597 domain-containing protein [Bryobacteraceae bacterium]